MLLKEKVPIWFLFGKIKYDFIAIIIYSSLVIFLHDKYIFKEIDIPISISGLLGTAISLLLAFRTNQAYDRWWEARKAWGAIINDSRTLIRQVQEFYESSNKDIFIKDFVNRQIAWCYALGEKLRGNSKIETINEYLNPEEIENVKQYTNVPNAILSLHTNTLRNALRNKSINEFQQIQMDSTISRLCDHMGTCERIKNTPFPITYSMLLHLLIYIFAAILPFGLFHYSILVEITLNSLISSIFLLIEKTAVYKQDPFENRPTDICVTAITRTIEINLLQMIGSKEIPEPTTAKSYYIM